MREKITIPEKVQIKPRQMPLESPAEFLPFQAAPDGTSAMPAFGDGYQLHITGLTHDERGYPDASSPQAHATLVNRLCNKILKHTDDIGRIKSFYTDDAEVVVLTYGAPARPGLKAVRMAREEGLKVGFIKLDTVWPFPENAILESLKGASRVIVAEMNLGQIFYEVQRILPGVKVERAPKIGGEMHLPQEILHLIKSKASSGG
jgi:2-oxoglutarate ferredoxin oxidoreductase subunit alpha